MVSNTEKSVEKRGNIRVFLNNFFFKEISRNEEGFFLFLLFLEKWGKSKYLHSQIVSLDISEDKQTVKRARGCCVHIFLVTMHFTTQNHLMISAPCSVTEI